METIKEKIKLIKELAIPQSNAHLIVSKHNFNWLIEQAEKVAKVEHEVDNSDMGTAVENIIEIVKR